MTAELESGAALELATSLKTIPGFPWDAIAATAEDLTRWCHGAIVANRVYPPEAQAAWLVTTARETWEKWLGTGALKQLFDGKFPARNTAGNEWAPLGEKPPFECLTCRDTGIVRTKGAHQYCDCEVGVRMEIDPELGAQWLKLMDRSIRPQPAEAGRRKRLPTFAELEADYFAARKKGVTNG